MRSLVIYLFLYACESQTLTAGLEKKVGLWDEEGYLISHLRPTTKVVRRKIQAAVVEYAEILTILKKENQGFVQ